MYLHEQEASQKQQKRQAKQAAWKRVQNDYPDTADFITSMTATFGKPAMLVVRDAETDEVILDSRAL